jgi:hypothetical protein
MVVLALAGHRPNEQDEGKDANGRSETVVPFIEFPTETEGVTVMVEVDQADVESPAGLEWRDFQQKG